MRAGGCFYAEFGDVIDIIINLFLKMTPTKGLCGNDALHYLKYYNDFKTALGS